MNPSIPPDPLSKTFISALAFQQSPTDLMQMVAAGLQRLRSTKDGRPFWNIDPDVRGSFEPAFVAICPLPVQWGQSNVREGWAPDPIQTTLTLVCGCEQSTPENSTYWGLRLRFTLNAPAGLGIRPGSGEYHILASCAYAGMILGEKRLLTREQLPGFWRLTEGAWGNQDIRGPVTGDSIGRLSWGLQPFGFGQVTDDGVRTTLEIRSWLTGVV